MEGLRQMLNEHALSSHETIFTGLGYHSVQDLLAISEEQADDLRDALVENGADKKAPRTFLRALQNKASQPAESNTSQPSESRAARPNMDYIHFYGFAEKINRTDVSGLEESTILKIDIDPLSEQCDRMHVLANILCRLAQTSSTDPLPVVSLLGPTGTGKSFIASTFLQSNDGVLPLVASPDQHMPTSAHVCVHRAAIHSGSTKSRPILLFDVEGEDGRTPRTLLEVGLRKLNVLRMAGLTEDALQKQLEDTTARRQEVIKERLPPMAYLLSDVVVFIDTVEPRRTERVDRIRHFAKQAHQAVESLAWQPALILVQNKWIPETENAAFNVNHELDWLLADLSGVFSSVTVMRIAHSKEHGCFEASLNEFHNELSRMVEVVFGFRQEQGVLFSERDFWFNFKPMVTQFGKPGQVYSGLENFVSRNVASSCAAENTLHLCDRLTAASPSPSPEQFWTTVSKVLLWYAYSQAGEVRRDGLRVEDAKQRFRKTYNTVVELMQKKEPCSAELVHKGKTYPCTQLCTGHPNTHKNPALLAVPSENLVKRIVSFGLWKDEKPCVWSGTFRPSVQPSYKKLESVFLSFVRQDLNFYLRSSKFEQLFKELDAKQLGSESPLCSDICLLCLRADSEQASLKNPFCRHRLCRTCLMTRMMLLGPENKNVICPFCHNCSEEQSHSSQDEKGFRILSLDGGGVRGLIEVLVLKRLEEVFDPLPITSLFDLIIGTSAGGLISMALLKRVPLSCLETLLETMAQKIFSVPLSIQLWRWAFGGPACCSESFGVVLKDLFGHDQLRRYEGPPYVFCVAYDAQAEEPVVLGNYPANFQGTATLSAHKISLWAAALSTMAAPTIFDSFAASFRWTDSYSDGSNDSGECVQELVDGGVVANCPAAVGIKVATELQSGSKGFDDIVVESIASIGTGLPRASVAPTKMNALSWAGKLIDIATNAERQWRDQIEEVAEFQSKPRVRVNPPKLGSLDAFRSESIPKLRKGMGEYFASDLGKQQMGTLVHMTYAKLWAVKQAQSLVAGEPGVKFSIVMQDHRCDFHSMEIAKLKDTICKRRQGLEENHLEGNSKDELCRMAKEAFESKPFLHDFQGKFGYRFAGVEYELADGRMEFNIEHHKAGAPELDVFWRSVHGDISLSGLPRPVRVSE